MNGKNEIPVALATDDCFAGPCGVVMESVLQNTSSKEDIHFHVFSDDLSNQNCKKLKKTAKDHKAQMSIKNINSDEFEGLVVKNVKSKSTYLRLRIPYLMNEYEKIIYLDSDILFEKKIEKLFSVDLKNRVAAAVPHGPVPFAEEFRRENEMSEGSPVFNAGVLVLNPKKWVEKKIAQRAKRWIESKDREDLFFPDQDAINVVLEGQINPLNYHWNMEARYYKEQVMGISDWWTKEAKGKKLVLHYTGAQKPWVPGIYVPRQDAYREYWRSTPFSLSDLISESELLFQLNRMVGWARLVASAARVQLGRFRRRVGRALSSWN